MYKRQDLLDAGVDAVTITTPPETRRDLVLQAIAAGVHAVSYTHLDVYKRQVAGQWDGDHLHHAQDGGGLQDL